MNEKLDTLRTLVEGKTVECPKRRHYKGQPCECVQGRVYDPTYVAMLEVVRVECDRCEGKGKFDEYSYV